jgi:hypothetical protein
VGAVVGALLGITIGVPASVAGIMPEIGAYIGVPTLLGGWALHLTISFVTCIVFAAALSTSRLEQYAGRLRTLLALGFAFGVLTWVVLDVLVIAYLGVTFDVPGAVFPNLAVGDGVLTLVFGVLTGAFYYGTRRWLLKGSPVAQ